MQDVKYLKDQKYKRTKKGLVTKIYALQKSHSKKRGHSFPVYSKNDLKTWLYSQPTFHLIYSNWVANNYAKDLTPSCDRLSNKLGYSLDNLQVITWLENKKLGEKDMREGNLPNCRTPYRPVVQRCKKTLAYVNHYISLHDAYRLTGISQGNISKAANGKQKSAGGYIWQLIPDGMRYNKELDKLVPDVISASNEYCSGIKVEFEKVVDYTKNITMKQEDKQILDELRKSGKSYLEIIDIIKNTDTFTPSYYGAKCKCGEKLDAYAICDKYSNEHKTSAWHHAVKKLLRAGDGHKSLLKDIDEVIDSLKRWKEQLNAK